MPKPCTVPGCDQVAKSHGLCGMHRLRYVRHGHLDQTRPEGWGKGHGHPLYERWRSMRRAAAHDGGHVERWRTFVHFAEDVGKIPAEGARLYRKDETQPFGPTNFEWRERIAKSGQSREARNAYMREFSRQRPHIRKGAYLRRHYGVSLDWYDEKFTEQDGLCAICRGPETRRDPRSGEPYMLAVDHDHKTNKPRALLCSSCNHGLGNFADDIGRLRAAIAYLERHIEPSQESA